MYSRWWNYVVVCIRGQLTSNRLLPSKQLTHWGRVTHICVGKLTNIGSDNGLSPGRRQAIIWTNAGILSIGPLGTNLSEISIEIHTFSIKKMSLKMSSAKWRLFRLGLNVLMRFLMYQRVVTVGKHHNYPSKTRRRRCLKWLHQYYKRRYNQCASICISVERR